MNEDPQVFFIQQLLSGLLFGVICAVIAAGRGRSAVGWFFIGLLTSCVGLVILLVLPDPRAEEERRRRLDKENRRLKEKLRRDRHVSDQRHREAERRLAVHDVALDIDTAPKLEAASDAEHLGAGSSAPDPASPAPDPALQRSDWYYLLGEKQMGPVSLESIASLWRDDVLNDSTYVWNGAMSDWKPLAQVDGLEDRLRG